jgi:flagellar hook-associated protein 3 FlgL
VPGAPAGAGAAATATGSGSVASSPYVFGGTRTDQPPYGAGDAYQGSTATVARQIGPGVALDIGVLGSSFLGDGQAAADGKVLAVLRDVADHLRADDGAALRADIPRLDTGLDTLLGVRAQNGARQNRFEAALSRLSEVEESTLTQLSDTEDADIAKTIIDFNSQQAAYQAALKAGASILQPSLMDFLH